MLQKDRELNLDAGTSRLGSGRLEMDYFADGQATGVATGPAPSRFLRRVDQENAIHGCVLHFAACNVLDSRISTSPYFQKRLRLVVVVELPSNQHSPNFLRACANGIQASISKEPSSWVLWKGIRKSAGYRTRIGTNR
jgi:hypothetical protein